MPRRRPLATLLAPSLVPLLVGTLAGAFAVVAAPAAAALAQARLAVAPVQDRVGDPTAVAAVSEPLRQVLAAEYDLVDASTLRDALRAGRLREVDAATPEELARVGRATGAELLLSTTLHRVYDTPPPRLALSARLYSLADGRLVWSGFAAASGLDHRGVLELGVIDALDPLAARLVRRLLGTLSEAGADGVHSGAARRTRPHARAAGLGTVALVPLSSVTERAGTAAAAEVTEIVRAELFRQGVATVSPGAVTDTLRRHRLFAWGGVDGASRDALGRATGARFVLTGSVESYEVGGVALEPEPHVTVALRLIDCQTGRIVWTGARDRRGWDGLDLFHLGRTYTRAQLAQQITHRLVTRLLDEQDEQRGSRTFRLEGRTP